MRTQTATTVATALERLIAHGEVGVQVAAYYRGELVLDESCGSVRRGGPPVKPSTIFFTASAGKVSTAALLHRQVERGLIDYGQTIASVWPEFGAAGKESFTVRDALTHSVGLADLPEGTTPELMGNWAWMVEQLAAAAPSADPADRHAYHARTWGYVVGEIARRVDPTDRAFEDLLRDEVHAPIGVSEVFHHVPAELDDRVALVAGDVFSGEPIVFSVDEDHEFNTQALRRRTDPSGVWMTARSAARLWSLYANAGVVDGTRLLSTEHVHSMLAPRVGAHPGGWMVGDRGVIGNGGLMLGGAVADHEKVLGFVGDEVLWHPGAGGALGFADLGAQLAVMICHTTLFDERLQDQHQFAELIRALYADLGIASQRAAG